jgi:membrane fusion protein (multidrug efflux system)
LVRLLLVLPLVAAVMLSSCSKQEETEPEQRPVSVETMVLQPSAERVLRTYTASLEGEQQADIYAKIAEAVEQVRVREGQTVKTGQVLISLDKTGPSSMYRTAESVLRNAEKNHRKMDFLYKEGAVAESRFDAATTEYEVAKADFDAAARLVEVESPIGGTVTSLDVTAGDYLYTGQKLATVASTDRLRARFGVNARDVGYFEEDAAVTITADEIGRELSGRVVSVAGSADPVTRAFQIEVLLDNGERLYRPGMFVRVSAVVAELDSVLVVPRSAVLTLEGKQTAFVVSNGTAYKRLVELDRDLSGSVVVASGLSPGDTLVTLGQNYLDDGFPVRITATETSAR